MAARHVQIDRRDMMQSLDDYALIRRYRLDRAGIDFIVNLISTDIQPATRKAGAVSSVDKVLITLRFLATGKMQMCEGDAMGLSQPTVSRCVSEVLRALSTNAMVLRFVRFPLQQQELQENQRKFYQIAHFPGVIGLIDGTHIQIQAPTDDEPEYVNRQKYHSINVQLVFDADDRIIDVVARHPGSAHDSRMLNNSGLRGLMERGFVPPGHYLLGDSGYPCKRWLLTPYLRPGNPSQVGYNRAHKTTRSKVERGIGILKRRWHVLHGEIRLAPEKACRVTVVCAVLHNICKVRNIPLPDGDGHQAVPHVAGPLNGAPQDGLRFRDYIAQRYF